MDSIRDTDGFIDVKKLIARYSVEEHRNRADAYFASYSEQSVLLRKPFQSVGEAAQIMQGLSIVLRELKLFGGVRVVDFGAGTAWLSRILAYLNCEAIAVDLSRSALDLGGKVIDKDNFADQLKISYLAYDGVTIPLPDADVERICCFDAFHHVADQKGTLQEFFRIMKPGGIAAFHEPGPHHSRSRDSQLEMENYHVIENDIFIEQIAAVAKEVGFRDIKVAWYAPSPVLLGVNEFNKLIGPKPPRAGERAIFAHAASELQNKRIFFLYKPGEEVVDSRRPEGLKARLKVSVLRREGDVFAGSLTVENTGTTVWLPSGAGLGAVRVGVQIKDGTGKMSSRDYERFDLSDTPVRPGERRTVDFRLAVPDLTDYSLVFDLVSEYIIWFAQLDARHEVVIASRDLPG